MNKRYILALDQGTTGSRAFLSAFVLTSADNPDEYGEIVEENFAISYESGLFVGGK